MRRRRSMSGTPFVSSVSQCRGYPTPPAVAPIKVRTKEVNMEWQPIETAPKDGTFILCYHSSGHINVQQYCQDKFWRSSIDNAPHIWQPTHWMPLPPPPAKATASEGAV